MLLDFDGHPSLRADADRWRGRVGYVLGKAEDRPDASVLLVGPDGIVAWAASADTDEEDVISAVSRWLTPTSARAPADTR